MSTNRWGLLLLAVLPIVLAVVFHHPEWLKGRRANLGPDGHFYVYQMGRVAELNGAWWKLADDDRVGHPYPTGAAKNPGLFEGLDLLILGAVVGQVLSPVGTFHFVAMAALVMNGWASSWLALRLTRSMWAGALASYITVVNLPTLIRLEGHEHLHLVKYSWIALSFWCFSRYLDAPTPRRGLWLGLAAAGTLLTSFHFGFFLVLGLAFWWLGCLIRGSLTRAHLRPTLGAILAAGALAALGTFPVWSGDKNPTLAKFYSQRDYADVWTYSAEPWQYVTRPQTKAAESRLKASARQTIPNAAALVDTPLDNHVRGIFDRYGNASGSWNYYGATALLGLGLFAVMRLRGSNFGLERPALFAWGQVSNSPEDGPEESPGNGNDSTPTRRQVGKLVATQEGPVALDRMAGLIAFWIVLSLAGGPGAFLYDLTPQFRCYGRAGLVALPLVAVLAAVVWYRVFVSLPNRIAKASLVVGVLALLAFDWKDASRMRLPSVEPSPPAWVPWLKAQPDDVRLVALPASDQSFCWGEVWHWQSLAYSFEHRHRTLNGGEFAFVYADLQLLGTGYHDLGPAGLQFMVTLGYNAFAFDEAGLRRSPWLAKLAWMKREVELPEGWSIWRIDASAPRFPVVTRKELLERGIRPALTVPVGAVICPRFNLNETVIAADSSMVEARWIDAGGTATDRWMRILEQCVYGPGLGAYTVRAPARPGEWKLRFRDRASGHTIGEQSFNVVDSIPAGTGLSSQAIVAPLADYPDGRCRIRIKNDSPHYLAARASEDKVPVSHPTLAGVSPGALVLTLRVREVIGDREESFELRRAYLADLGPGEGYDVILPPGTLSTEAVGRREIVGVLYSGPELIPLVETPAIRVTFSKP